MTSIRNVRKACKRKYGIKTIIVYVKLKDKRIHLTPTARRILRQQMTEKMRTHF